MFRKKFEKIILKNEYTHKNFVVPDSVTPLTENLKSNKIELKEHAYNPTYFNEETTSKVAPGVLAYSHQPTDYSNKYIKTRFLEPAFSGKLNTDLDPGNFHCVICDQELFNTDAKYKTELYNIGYPLFFNAIENQVNYHTDVSESSSTNATNATTTAYPEIADYNKHNRIKIKYTSHYKCSCSKCGGMLGTVFVSEENAPFFNVYVINSRVLRYRELDVNEMHQPQHMDEHFNQQAQIKHNERSVDLYTHNARIAQLSEHVLKNEFTKKFGPDVFAGMDDTAILDLITKSPDIDKYYSIDKYSARKKPSVKINKTKANKNIYPLKEDDFKRLYVEGDYSEKYESDKDKAMIQYYQLNKYKYRKYGEKQDY